MRRLVLILAFLSSLISHGQNLEKVKAYNALLADSAFFGRGYVNDGSNLAANFLIREFQELKLLPVEGGYAQLFEFSVNTFPTQLNVDCGGKELIEGKDYILNPGSGSANGNYKLVYADSTDFQESIPIFRRNRIPVIDLEGIDTPDERSYLYEYSKVQLQEAPLILLQPDKLTWSVGPQRYAYPEIEILKSEFPKNARKCAIGVENREIQYEARNVIGYIPGARSDSSLIITAHYDHLGMMGDAIFPGASDNASGTAMLLDFANYFAVNQPEFDTYFIAFAAEEAGLLGSKYFVDHPMIDLSKIKMLINLDLMGSAAEGLAIVNGKRYPDLMRRLSALNNEGPDLQKIKVRGQAPNSDHYWFAEKGVPAIFIYTIGNAKAYHDVYDTTEGLDWANYNEVFTLILQFLHSL